MSQVTLRNSYSRLVFERLLYTGVCAKGYSAIQIYTECLESLGAGSGGTFLIVSKPAVCRLRPHLFARLAVFPSDAFAVANFVLHASSSAVAKR